MGRTLSAMAWSRPDDWEARGPLVGERPDPLTGQQDLLVGGNALVNPTAGPSATNGRRIRALPGNPTEGWGPSRRPRSSVPSRAVSHRRHASGVDAPYRSGNRRPVKYVRPYRHIAVGALLEVPEGDVAARPEPRALPIDPR